ncbi:Serine/threonine-protein phosphatase CPPED1 [Hypsibius exemplaris]|uniref:Serine/threonine-protein phosphatase CPPED1 n=1 Tax=Hypsibius exemplaris TaxID=2072580 RepID=A0A9X6NJL0_HYPEX|nr:Serine/threonine-protein phosphatase CPPED1 [Hypsibius exemplaris]
MSAETPANKDAVPPDVRLKDPRKAFQMDAKWRGPFFFVQGADPQFGMFDGFLRGKTDPKLISWEEDIALMRIAANDLNKMTPLPAFFVICGDLVHEFDVNPLKKAQERDLLRILADIDPAIPIALIPGNHDIQNTPTALAINHFKDTFGPDYYTFDARGLRCICINSQFFKSFEATPSAEFLQLQKDFFRWFDGEIDRTAHDLRTGLIQHAVVFQHIAWFLERPDEPDDYFNVDYQIRQIYLQKLVYAGIKACFCGHYHRNGGGKAGPHGELEVVVTSAIGMTLAVGTDGQLVEGKADNPSGMRVVKVTDESITHDYFPLHEFPTEVKL